MDSTDNEGQYVVAERFSRILTKSVNVWIQYQKMCFDKLDDIVNTTTYIIETLKLSLLM